MLKYQVELLFTVLRVIYFMVVTSISQLLKYLREGWGTGYRVMQCGHALPQHSKEKWRPNLHPDWSAQEHDSHSDRSAPEVTNVTIG